MIPQPGKRVMDGAETQMLAGIDKVGLRLQHPLSHPDSRPQLARLTWLLNIVVAPASSPG